jgi:cyclopropane-fatty-acyl-phospholipid synthase
MLELPTGTGAPPNYAVDFKDGTRLVNGAGPLSFVLTVPNEDRLDHLMHSGTLEAGVAFVNGEIDVSGDIVAAIRTLRSRIHPSLFQRLWTAIAGPVRLETWFQSRERAAADLRFHYDRSNEFYARFLDSRLVYSSALFEHSEWSLDQAQLAKLDSICRKLDLQPGDTFLDVGCGWGALVVHAARYYRANASGCTLSHHQYELANSAVAAHGLENRVRILESDYRSLTGRFRKIASVGMFEHVGRHRLAEYFRTIHRLLEEDGLFLNSGITRPQRVRDDGETSFLQREVFPGGELAHLSNIIRDAENAGFEVLQLESIRMHYARTCREWVARLQNNAGACIELVGENTWRTWLLYLAASVVNFEDGQTDAYQMLLARRPPRCSVHRMRTGTKMA